MALWSPDGSVCCWFWGHYSCIQQPYWEMIAGKQQSLICCEWITELHMRCEESLHGHDPHSALLICVQWVCCWITEKSKDHWSLVTTSHQRKKKKCLEAAELVEIDYRKFHLSWPVRIVDCVVLWGIYEWQYSWRGVLTTKRCWHEPQLCHTRTSLWRAGWDWHEWRKFWKV